MSIRLAHTKLESLPIRDYYNKVKLVSHYSALEWVLQVSSGLYLV